MEPALPNPADPAIARSAMRKTTWRLIPLIALGYGAAYMDRVNISFAALQMNRDLHLSPAVYGFGAGVFFLPYAICEIPSNLLLYRFGARRWLSRIMLTWGVIATAMLLVHSASEFYLARFLLGVAEAGFFPGIIFYLTQWFPPEQRARTISRFYIALPLSSVFMGLVAGSLLNLNGRMGLAGWQWLFLVEGVPAILLAACFFFLLPDSPASASWLNPAERSWLVSAVARDETGTTHRADDIRGALRDPRVWQLGLFNIFSLTSSYAYIFIAPDLVQRSTHLNATLVGYIIAALGVLGAAAMLLNAALSDRALRNGDSRFPHILLPCLMVSAGFLACGLSSRPTPVILGLAVLIAGWNAMQGPLWAIPGSFLQGRSGAAGIAAINMIGMTGGFLGPYWIGLARTLTGNYERGMLLMSLPMLLGAALMLRIQRQARTAVPPRRATGDVLGPESALDTPKL